MDTVELRQANAPPWRCGLLLCLISLNVFIPSLVLSYGVILACSAEQGIPEWITIACPTLLAITFCMTQCWCREAADSWGGESGHRVMACLGLIMIFIGVLACAFAPTEFHPLLYGVLGGVGTSLISAQVDTVIFDTYDTRLGIVRGFCYAGQAVGQFLLPHIFLQLIEYYGLSMFYLILSAFLLQTLPCILCLKISHGIRRTYSASRYSDFARHYDMFTNDAASASNYHTDMQLYDLSKKCWQSPSDDNKLDKLDFVDSDESEIPTTLTPPPSPEEKRKNVFGVEILPDIPEESEASISSNSDSDIENNVDIRKKYIHSAIKRLSVMSDNFEEYITKSKDRRYSERDENDNRRYSEIGSTYSNISPMTEIKRENVLNSFNFRCSVAMTSIKRTVHIPSYKVYRIRRRFIFCCYSLYDTFLKPLSRSLSYWRFYPALLLCFSKLSLTVLISSLIPIFSLQAFPSISILENNFLMSLHAFTWLCFLLSTPWVSQLSKSNHKYIVVGGLLTSTASLFLIGESSSHDVMAIGCVIAGFGFGAITSSWEATARDFIGVRKWSKVQSTLETLSATCVGVFVLSLTYLIPMEDGLRWCVLTLAVVQASVTGVWAVIAVVQFYTSAVKSYRLTDTLWSH